MSGARPRPLWLEDLLESLEGWWQGIALAIGAALLWGGFALRWVGQIEMYVILIGFPLIAAGAAGLALREVRGAVLALGLAATLAAAGAAEARVVQVLLPPQPFATAALTTAARDATIEVPAAVQALRVIVHGDLEGAAGQSSVEYVLALERAGARHLVKGELSRQVQQGRSFGGGPPSTSVSLHQTDAHEVTLPGPGSVQVHLNAVDGEHDLRVSIAAAAAGAHLLERGLLALIGLAAVVQALAARRQRRLPLTPLIGAAAVFAIAVGRWFTPDASLMFAIGVALLSVFSGGLGGWLIGAIAARVARTRASLVPGPGA